MTVSPTEVRLARYPEAMEMLHSGEADERLELALAMVAAGLRGVDIAAELGVARSTVYQILKDPRDEKALARKRQGTCVDCGTTIRSDSPSGHFQLRCISCYKAYQHATRKWTPETIIEALRRWNDLYGSPPPASALNGQGSAENLRRYREGDFPPLGQITRHFPRFGDALVAAGFIPRHPSACKPRNTVSDETYREMVAMRDAGATYSEIAEQFGINVPAARERIKRWNHKHRNGEPMPTALRAENVIEREIARFESRKQKAEADAADATEQIDRLKTALAALTNGKPASTSADTP